MLRGPWVWVNVVGKKKMFSKKYIKIEKLNSKTCKIHEAKISRASDNSRSPIPLPRGQQSKYANPLWYKRIRNSVRYVKWKQAKEKLETELLFLKDVNICD